MRHRLTARRSQLRARLYYLWRNEDSAGVELLLAALSLSLALNLMWPHQDISVPHPPWFWGLFALMAGTLKLVGVPTEWRWARIVGLIVGAGFWCAFAVVFGFVADGPIWVPYMVLALSNIGALRKVVSP